MGCSDRPEKVIERSVQFTRCMGERDWKPFGLRAWSEKAMLSTTDGWR
jgi:hypothetical protein